MLNTFYDCYRILYRVYGQKAYIKQAINAETIEPINKNAVIKICYGVVENDILLDYYINAFLCDKNPKLPVRIILKIALYNIEFLKKAPYAVTNNSVELLKKLGKGGMSGFVNAVLRKFVKIRDNIYLPDDILKKLSIKYSYPLFAVQELVNDYGKDRAEQIMGYHDVHNYIRFNSCENGEQYLIENNCTFSKTVFNNLFDVQNFKRDDGYDKGIYTFQSIGSVAICDIVNGEEKLLDACAAPGGKSVLLSEKFNQITSCELHEHRVELIKSYAQRMKCNNIKIMQCDSSVYNENFDSSFQAVLCDCPCTGFGVVIDNPDIKINRDYENLEELNSIQLKILTNCAKYVQLGGYLYYSTCSILNKENDNIISRFLSKEKSFDICKINSPLSHVKTDYGLQFIPDISSGAGFYICKMKKTV